MNVGEKLNKKKVLNENQFNILYVSGQLIYCAFCEHWTDKDGKLGLCNVEVKGRRLTQADEWCKRDEIREMIRQNAKWVEEGKNVKEERERMDKVVKESVLDKPWTPDNCYEKAMAIFNASGLPQPTLTAKYEDVSFPEDIDKVSNKDLGDMLFKFGALKAYAANKLVEWDIKYHALKLGKEMRMGKLVDKMEKSAEKKRLKEAMQADAVENDKMLNELVKREIQAQSNYKKFQSAYEQYGIYWDTASREITRRNDELKIIARGDSL